MFGNPRIGSFEDPTNSVLYGCVDVIVCYKGMSMTWGTMLNIRASYVSYSFVVVS